MDNDDIDIVRQSFGRCTLTDGFLISFYDILIGSSDEIRDLFADTDMPRQRGLLKEALIYLISFPTGNEFARNRVIELGNSHNRTRLNVRRELYQIWVDSLLRAIQRHDSNYDSDLDAAWRKVVAPGIGAMMALYDQSPPVA